MICEECKNGNFCKFREDIEEVMDDTEDDIYDIENISNGKVIINIIVQCEYFE